MQVSLFQSRQMNFRWLMSSFSCRHSVIQSAMNLRGCESASSSSSIVTTQVLVSDIESKNVDTVSVKQCRLILLPTCHHLLQLLLRIVLQESVVKLRTIVLNSHHLLDWVNESNSLHWFVNWTEVIINTTTTPAVNDCATKISGTHWLEFDLL